MAASPPATSPDEQFQRGNAQMTPSLGLFSATALVVGSMVGSGIYIVDSDIARSTNSPALFLAAWVITAAMTMIGALSYGELAAMMPKAGGQYVYLRESLGPLCGFLYGWTFFMVIQTGSIAAVCVAFGKFAGVFFPSISGTHWLWHIAHVPPIRVGPMVLGNMEIGVNTANLVGIVVVIVLALLNMLGVRLGALVQNVFTVAKALSLAGLIALGFTVGRNAQAITANFGRDGSGFWHNAGWSTLHPIQVGMGGPTIMVNLLVILAVVQVGSLFSSDSWNNVTFTAGETKDPQRNIPLSLALGTGFVLTAYFFASTAYLMILPLHGDPHGATIVARGIQYATEDRIGTAALTQVFPHIGGYLMAAAILVSTFGCANGLSLAGARVYYAMSRDGLFFRAVGRLHPRYKTPAAALAIQAVWAIVLCISGTYSQLLDYIIFAVLVFYILTICGLFVLRRKRPGAARPYKAFGYPWFPALYILLASGTSLALLRYKPQYTWPGLILVLLGIPVYLLWTRLSPQATQHEIDPLGAESSATGSRSIL
jgi:APA family basic amino acid/polyamine antiporter